MQCNFKQFELPEKTFIGGDYKEFYWDIVNDDTGEKMDCTHLKMNFSLVEFNNRNGEAILEKECVIETSTAFKLILNKDDTKELMGVYIYQITISFPNKKQESYQGRMNIKRNINPNIYN